MPDSVDLLTGVNVVELSQGTAGAYCGRSLAVQGATVRSVKLRDKAQGSAPAEIYLGMYKEKIVIDPDDDDDTRELESLCASADIVVSDIELAELEGYGLDPARIRAQYPSIVFALISPFGMAGPRSDWLGTDLEVQAFGGLMAMLGWAEGTPLAIPYDAGLVQAGSHANAAILAALLNRDAGRGGATIDICAAQCMMACIRGTAALQEYYDIPIKRSGPSSPGNAGRYPVRLFPCSDGYVLIMARNEEQWHAIVAMIGNPAWANEPRYQNTHGMAFDYPEELDALIFPWTRQRTRAQLMEAARIHKVPAGSVLTLEEVLQDEQFLTRGFFTTIGFDGQEISVPTHPVHWTSAS